MTRDLASYQLPYERVWEARAEGSDVYFLVRLRDLPMVAADGHNKAEALSNLRSAFDDFIEWAIADGVYVRTRAAIRESSITWRSSSVRGGSNRSQYCSSHSS